MNRSKPIRRTPMPNSAKPLKRSELKRGTSQLQRTPLQRGGRLRLVSGKRQRENRQRGKVVRQLREAGDWCAMCGNPTVRTSGHERRGRAQGGDPTRPDLLLCDRDNGWCEDHPRLAAWQGWKVSRKWPTAPCIEAGVCPYGAHELGEHCGVAA